MDLNMLFDNYDLLMGSPNSTAKMRELIFQLAVQGKLVEQDPNDEPTSELLKRIKAEKEKLIAEGKIKKQRPLPPINKDEIPYGIPESWAWIRLEKVFYPISVGKKKIKTSEIIEEGPCPVIDQGQSYIAGYTDESNKIIKVPGPVIIFGDHTCELKLINFDFVAGADGVKVLRPIEIYENYFFLVLKTFKIEDCGYSRHYKYFLNNLLPLPPIAEQKRIVAKVDQLMQLCDQLDACQKKATTKYESLNDAALEKLLSSKTIDEFANHWQFICNNFDLIYNDPAHVNKLRQTILQLAVQGKLAPQDLNDEPASKLLKRIKTEKEKLIAEGKIKKQKPLPPITENEIPYDLSEWWEWVRFTDVAYIASNLVNPLDHSDMPHIAPNNIEKNTGKLLYHNTVREDDVRSPNHFFVSGQILYSKIRPNLSKVIIANFDGLCSADMYPVSSLINSKYLLIYMLSNVFFDMAVKKDNRVAMPKINQTELKLIPVPVPSLTEQKRIVAKVNQLMNLCDELETRLNQSKKDSEMLMQALMQEAFAIKQA